MRPYEEIRQQVRERLDGHLAERQRDALADLAARPGAPPAWQPLTALVGLGLIRLGERLRTHLAILVREAAPLDVAA